MASKHQPHIKIIKRKINGHEYAYVQGYVGKWSDETVQKIKDMLLPKLEVEVGIGEVEVAAE